MDRDRLRAVFDREGHVVVHDVLDAVSLRRWEDHLAACTIPPNGLGAVSLDHDPVARQLALDERLVGLAATLLGEPVELFGCTHLVKPPGSDLEAGWHQDGHPWREQWGIERAVTLWLALDEATPASGGLRVIPGSHHGALWPLVPAPGPDMFGWRTDPVHVDEALAVTVSLAPGDVSAHHPATLHASGPNRSATRRAVVALRFAAARGEARPDAGAAAREAVSTLGMVEELERIARTDFGIQVARRLPITESFSSTVLSFIGSDDRHYVLKRHWARPKAEREVAALRALDGHAAAPALLGTSERDGTLTLLIEGLDGTPWVDDGDARPELLRGLGRAMGHLHLIPADSFDGMGSWHELLSGNADRYVASIGSEDIGAAERARDVLRRHLGEVPASEGPCLVHFDLRPGNVLVRDGRLVGIIDFEACRGGHGSMDFFKLWQQVPGALGGIVEGYREVIEAPGPWADLGSLSALMQIYAAYHGLAGLAWCHTRNDFSGDFPAVNRGLIRDAVAALE